MRVEGEVFDNMDCGKKDPSLERVAAFQIQDSPTADVVIPCLEAHMGGANGQGTSNRVASAGRRVCG